MDQIVDAFQGIGGKALLQQFGVQQFDIAFMDLGKRLFCDRFVLDIVFPTMKPLKDASGENDGKMEAGKAAGEGVTGRADVPAAIEIKDEPIDFSKVEIEPLFQDQVDFETFSKSDFRAVKVMACEAVPKSKKLLKFTLDDGTGQDRVILSGIHAYYEPEDLVGKTLIAIVNLPPRKMMGIDSCGMLLSAIHSEEGQERLNLLMADSRIPAGAKLY